MNDILECPSDERCIMENNVYLPGTPAQRIRDRLGALNMSQAELAKAAGLTEGTLSRILQERTKSIKSQDLVGIATALNVSTDFLLGLTNLPGRKNYSIEQLGLSDQAMQTLVGNQIDRNVLSQLLAHKDFPTITRLIAVYADATMAAGLKAQRDMLQSAKAVLKDLPGAGSAVSAMIRANLDTADVTAIQNGLLKIIRDIRDGNVQQTYENVPPAAVMFGSMVTQAKSLYDAYGLEAASQQVGGHITAYIANALGFDPGELEELQAALTHLFQRQYEKTNEKVC